MYDSHIRNCRAFDAPGKPSPDWETGYNGLVRVPQLKIPPLAATWQPLLYKAVDERNAIKLEHGILEVNYKMLEQRFQTLQKNHAAVKIEQAKLTGEISELEASVASYQHGEHLLNIDVADLRKLLRQAEQDLEHTRNQRDDLSKGNANQATTIANLALRIADLEHIEKELKFKLEHEIGMGKIMEGQQAELRRDLEGARNEAARLRGTLGRVAPQSKTVIHEPLMFAGIASDKEIDAAVAPVSRTAVELADVMTKIVFKRVADAIWDHVVSTGKEDVKWIWLRDLLEEKPDARS